MATPRPGANGEKKNWCGTRQAMAGRPACPLPPPSATDAQDTASTPALAAPTSVPSSPRPLPAQQQQQPSPPPPGHAVCPGQARPWHVAASPIAAPPPPECHRCHQQYRKQYHNTCSTTSSTACGRSHQQPHQQWQVDRARTPTQLRQGALHPGTNSKHSEPRRSPAQSGWGHRLHSKKLCREVRYAALQPSIRQKNSGSRAPADPL